MGRTSLFCTFGRRKKLDCYFTKDVETVEGVTRPLVIAEVYSKDMVEWLQNIIRYCYMSIGIKSKL
ncbi:hypothetical protein CCP3SC1AL1_3160003 [Gammaproteobacteria bacterium]